DLCLVHNGSLSNHNRLRRSLAREGIPFQIDNDSEVAAGYLTWRLREGATLEQALEGCLDDLDGFYTFAVGTADGFAVLRDPIACKPAVMAETDEWVAMASEYRAIAVLPGAEDADTWEPEAVCWSFTATRRGGAGSRSRVQTWWSAAPWSAWARSWPRRGAWWYVATRGTRWATRCMKPACTSAARSPDWVPTAWPRRCAT